MLPGLHGELSNTFQLERHTGSNSSQIRGTSLPVPALLPTFHSTPGRTLPCLVQGSCFKIYDHPFASIISECKLRGKARSQVTQQSQGQLWVLPAPDLSLGDLLFLWLVFHHRWVEMKLFRAKKLGDEEQLQLGEDTDVVKHQPKLHWGLSMSLVYRGIERLSQVASLNTEVRTSSHSRKRERQNQCTPTLSRGLDKCGSKNPWNSILRTLLRDSRSEISLWDNKKKNSRKFEEGDGKANFAFVADVRGLDGRDLRWSTDRTPPDKFVSVVLFDETKPSVQTSLLVVK